MHREVGRAKDLSAPRVLSMFIAIRQSCTVYFSNCTVLDTKAYSRTVGLLHVADFLGYLQGGTRQRKTALANYAMDVHLQSLKVIKIV